MNIGGRTVVDLSLGDSDAMEYGNGLLLHPIRERAGLDQFLDVGKVAAMRVFVRVFFFRYVSVRMVVVLDELFFALFDAATALEFEDGLKLMGFRQQIGRFEPTTLTFEFERSSFLVRTNRFQHDCVRSGWCDGLARGIVEVKPKSGWHIRFEHTEFHLALSDFEERAAVRTVRATMLVSARMLVRIVRV